MTDNMETELRRALDARAHEVEVPDGLATRTLDVARESSDSASLRKRIRARRDGRRSKSPVAGYPKVLYGFGALATAVMLFVVGAVVTMPRDDRSLVAGRDNDNETKETGEDATADAVAGQVSGVVSSEDADAESGEVTGDTTGANEAASFVGLTPQLVRSADIEIAVRDFEDAWDEANDIASKFNGVVTGSNTSQIGQRIAKGTVTMRVPALKLDPALGALRDLGTLAQLSTSGDDSAVQLDDVKQRVKAARSEEEQLLELQRRANTVSESLDVRSRLEEARKNLASLKNQQKTVEDQIDFATIRGTITQDVSAGKNDGIVFNAFDTAVRIALTILAGILVVLGGLIPLAALAIAIWFAVRTARRRSSRIATMLDQTPHGQKG